MNTRSIKVTSSELDKLLADIRALPKVIIGDHLSDDESIGYVMQLLTPEEAQRVDEHLASCLDCAGEMGRMFATAEVWNGVQESRHQEKLSELFQSPIDRLRDFFKSSANAVTAFLTLQTQPAFATAPTSVDFESEDGAFVLFIEEEEDGSVSLRFDSSELELEGTIVRFHKGNWQWEARLERVPGNRVGAEVIVSRDERALLPSEGEFQVESIRG